MAHVEEKLPAVNAGLIGTTVIGATAGNLLKGLIWGSVAGVSQSFATAYRESAAVAKAAGKAVDIDAMKALTSSKAKVLVPSLVAHTAFFAAYRGSLENQVGRTNTGFWLDSNHFVALPTIGYAGYYRAMPPQALRFGVISAALLHLYDRCWHPKGINVEHMPHAKMQRRVW